MFRAQLMLHDKVREVFESSLRLARQLGCLKRRGMLVQLDGSHHARLEDRVPKFALLQLRHALVKEHALKPVRLDPCGEGQLHICTSTGVPNPTDPPRQEVHGRHRGAFQRRHRRLNPSYTPTPVVEAVG